MSFFSKIDVGEETFDVKDALAGKTLSLSGSELSLVKADGTAASTVALPSSGVKIITYSSNNDWQCDGESITTALKVNDMIVYISPSNPSIIKLKNGNSYLTKLNLISNSKTSMGNSTGIEYISLYCSFFSAIVTSVTSSRITARVINTDAHGYRRVPFNSSYSATTVEEHPYELGNILIEKTISSSYYPFIIKSSTTELTPTEVKLFIYDDNSYLLKYLFNLDASKYADIYTRNDSNAYDIVMYLTNPMFASSTYATSSNNHLAYLQPLFTTNAKLNVIGSSKTLNMAAGDAALFIYGMFPANGVDNESYF